MTQSSLFTKLPKFLAIIGIFLMLVLTGGPFFNYLKIESRISKVQANSSTTWTKSVSNPLISNSNANYPRVLKESSAFWSKFTVQAGTAIGQNPSLTLDSGNHPHVSYWDGDNNYVKYASYDGSSWTTATVDNADLVSPYPSLKLNASANPRISYNNSTELKYAYSDDSGATWTTVTIATVLFSSSSLALNASGNPRISYYNGAAGDLKYAACDTACNNVANWTITTVDSADAVGSYPSLALNASGQPRISYYDTTNGNIKFAYSDNNGSSWSFSTVGSVGAPSGNISLAIDTDGYYKVAYYDGGDGDLNYATSTNGTAWTPTTVDSTGNVGLFASMDLTSSNQARISYVTEDGNLKYASYNGASWDISTIDSSTVSASTSLALDSNNNPFIANYDNTAGDLQLLAGNQNYKMWIEASPGDIKMATSNDGIAWIGYADCTGDANVHEPIIIKDGSTYKMWYEAALGGSSYIAYKTSTDGLAWGDATQTIWSGGVKEWENLNSEIGSRYEPFVYKDGDSYVMHYQSWTSLDGEIGVDKRIDYATSNDGITWNNNINIGQVTFNGSTNNNIILTVGDDGAWDDYRIYSHSVLKNSDNAYELWYAAEGGDNIYKIGYATSSNGTTWTKSGSNPVVSGTTAQWDVGGILYPTVIQDSDYKMWFAADDWSGKIGYASALVADGDVTVPTITNVNSDKTNGSYKAGDVIDIDVTFSEAVTSTGDVTVTLETGDTDRACTFTISNATTGTCDYTVQTGDTSTDLTVKTIAGTIKDQANNAMTNFVPATNLAANKALVIDTTVPTSLPTMNDYYKASNWNNAIVGTASNGTSGVASVAITIQRNSDPVTYWTGSTWGAQTWLPTIYVAGTWTYSFSSVADGTTYTVQSRATDNAGNVQSSLGSDTFAYDTTAPSSTPTMNDFYNSGNWPGFIAGTNSDATSGVTLVEIKIQRSSDSYYWNGAGSVWQSSDPGWLAATITGSWAYNLTAANLTNGVAYTITSRATDGAGNVQSSYGSDAFIYHNMNWQQYRINPLLGTTNLGWFSVYKDDATYKMWYMKSSKIYYATASNGVTWEEGAGDQAVVDVTAGQWDSSIVLDPWVIKDGSASYKMWYAANNDGGNNYKIGYATSTDGTTWVKYVSNPVLSVGAGAAWDNLSVRKPTVIKDDLESDATKRYKMWYSGTQSSNTDYHLGYAYSSDGISWTKSASNPVLQNGTGEEWDASNIWGLSVIQRGNIYEMYYSGNNVSGIYQIGHAYSTDGVTWREYGSNPVITSGSNGTWNDSGVYAPFVLLDGTTYKMWYIGHDGTNTKWGYATMDAVADSTAPVSLPQITNTYYGTVLYNHTTTIVGSATDAWGIEKVELRIKETNGSDNRYWTGSAWSADETWVNATDYSGNGYLIWNYVLDDVNFTNGRTYTITSKATDGSGTVSGNVESSLNSDSFIWDATSPTATLAQFNGATPVAYYNSSSLPTSVAGTASDATSGVQEVALSIKRSTDNYYWRYSTNTWGATQYWDDATGTTSWTYSAVPSALLDSIRLAGDGITYTVYAAAYDNAWNNFDLNTNSSTVFTYDNTGPTAGSVNDGTGADSDYTSSTTQLAANWSGFADTLSGIQKYQYSIGTTAGGTNVTSWTDNSTNTSVTKTGLNLTNGQTYYVNVRAVDNANNTGTVATSDGITVDVGLPFSTPVMSDYYNASTWPGTISGTASSSVGLTQVEIKIQRSSDSQYWDGDSWETGTSWLVATDTASWIYPLATAYLTDGVTYTISSRATDNLSRTQDPPNTDNFAYDITNPTAPGTVRDGTGTDVDYTTSTTQLSANWTTSTDATSGIAKYQYAIGTTAGGTDVVSWTDNSTNISVTKAGLTLTNGQTYYFTARAVDGAANTGGITNSDGIMVDSTGPTAPGTPTDSGTYSNSTSQTFNWTAATDTGGSGVAGYYISIGTSAGATNVVNNFDVGNVLTYTRGSLSDGTAYYVKVRAYDNASNMGSYSGNSNGITIDTTAPVTDPQLTRTYYSLANWPGSITVNLTDATSGIWYAGIAINRNSDDYGWCDIDQNGIYSWTASYTCYTDTSDPGNTLTYTFLSSDLTTGESYTTDTYARDNASNLELPHTQETFTYDDTAPSTPTVNDGTGADIDSVESLTTLAANWTAATDAQSGINHYQYAIGSTAGGTDVVSWTSTGTTTSVTRSDLTLSVDQSYYFSVRAINGADITGTAGNSDGAIIVDQTAPTLNLTTYPSTPTNDSTPQLAGSVTDVMTNISTIQYKIDDSSWVAISAADGAFDEKTEEFNFNSSTLAEGSHTVYLRATDSKANTSASTSHTFTVDTTAPAAPSITSPTNGSTISDSTPTFQGSAEANSTILLTVSSDTKSYSTTADSNGVWSYTMPAGDALADGGHSLEAKARDAAGNTSAGSTITFNVQTVATTVTPPAIAPSAAAPVAAAPEVKKSQVSVISQKVEIPIIQTNQQVQVLANSQVGLAVKPSLDKEVKSINANFEGKNYDLIIQSDGTYLANILTPNQKGTYKVLATITYKDGTTEEVQINLLTDPYGYVFEKTKAGEQHLAGVKVTLYVWENNKWVVWDGSKYDKQANPQTTKDNGEYGFMVPIGKYYLVAGKDGYLTYKGKEFTVDQGQPVNINIELSKTSSLWWVCVLIGLTGIGVIYFWRKQVKNRKLEVKSQSYNL